MVIKVEKCKNLFQGKLIGYTNFGKCNFILKSTHLYLKEEKIHRLKCLSKVLEIILYAFTSWNWNNLKQLIHQKCAESINKTVPSVE